METLTTTPVTAAAAAAANNVDNRQIQQQGVQNNNSVSDLENSSEEEDEQQQQYVDAGDEQEASKPTPAAKKGFYFDLPFSFGRKSRRTSDTDCENSSRISFESSDMNISFQPFKPFRRSPTGILKKLTQQDSVSVYYGKERFGDSPTVAWGEIHIHSHAYCLGDNPSCSGPPLTCRWKAFNHEIIQINDIHQHKADNEYNDQPTECCHGENLRTSSSLPKNKSSKIISKQMREDILRNIGYSRGELQVAATEGELIRKSREKNSKLTGVKKYKKWVKTHLLGGSSSRSASSGGRKVGGDLGLMVDDSVRHLREKS